MTRFVIGMVLLILTGAMARADVPAQESVLMLENLPPHPRLFLRQGEEKQLRDNIDHDGQHAALWKIIQRTADDMLKQPVCERVIVGRRLLATSRECLCRITHLGMAWRLTHDQRYLQRAKQEMLAAAAFTDWHPDHFLDVAEMTSALAIGLDWLYDDLDSATRQIVREAIIAKGLKPSLEQTWWVNGENNWNQVCHGGMVLGAMAIAEDDRVLARQIVNRAMQGLPHVMDRYAPDGAYPEGVMYWDYGTSFNVLLIAALESALGSDLGLMQHKGFDRTAEYYLQMQGPSGLPFTYSDARGTVDALPSPAMIYLASRRSDGPQLLYHEMQQLEKITRDNSPKLRSGSNRLFPLTLIWLPAGEKGQIPQRRDYVAMGPTPVAVFRSSWEKDATFIGIKGGAASSSHAHMDVGAFVLDAMGVRWADDLGLQDYHSLEQLGINLFNMKQQSQRWQIFRLGAASHNVLMVDGENHDVRGVAPIVAHDDHSATVDMTALFPERLEKALRTAELRPDGSAMVRDEVKGGSAPHTVRWAMLTRAEVKLDEQGTAAVLVRAGKKLTLRIKDLPAVRLRIYPSDPPPASYDARNEGTCLVGFEVSVQPGESKSWTVEFRPAP